MKKLKITTKRNADKMILNSLFAPVNGKTLSAELFDGGKYRTNPETPYIGREVEADDSVYAVYPVRRKDKYGAYIKLYCLTC